jgi:membrane dipeptidase
MWGTMLTSVGAMLGGGLGPPGSTAAAETAATASAGLGVLRKYISVDVHTHGGTTGITSKAPPSDDLANGMRAGSLAVACLADVPDGPVLGRNAAGVLAAVRTPEPGMLYNTISSGLLGWTRWWRSMDCAALSPLPISRRRMPRGSRLS